MRYKYGVGCIPPHAGVAVLLSLCVFSELVNNTLPQTSDAVPLLG